MNIIIMIYIERPEKSEKSLKSFYFGNVSTNVYVKVIILKRS